MPRAVCATKLRSVTATERAKSAMESRQCSSCNRVTTASRGRPWVRVQKLKADRVEHWLKAGAQPSQTVAMLLKKAKGQKPAEKKA